MYVQYVVMFTRERQLRKSAQYVKHRQRNSNFRMETEHGLQEHVVGVAKGVSEDIVSDLRANFEGECSEVGMYLAMARVAYREGYPEVGSYYEKAAWEEAEHAAKFAELLGEVVTDSTKKTLRCELMQKTAQLQERLTLQREPKLQTLMRSMTPYMRWLVMRQDTEKHLRAY